MYQQTNRAYGWMMGIVFTAMIAVLLITYSETAKEIIFSNTDVVVTALDKAEVASAREGYNR